MHLISEIDWAANNHLGIGITDRFRNIKNMRPQTKYEYENFGIQVSHILESLFVSCWIESFNTAMEHDSFLR